MRRIGPLYFIRRSINYKKDRKLRRQDINAKHYIKYALRYFAPKKCVCISALQLNRCEPFAMVRSIMGDGRSLFVAALIFWLYVPIAIAAPTEPESAAASGPRIAHPELQVEKSIDRDCILHYKFSNPLSSWSAVRDLSAGEIDSVLVGMTVIKDLPTYFVAVKDLGTFLKSVKRAAPWTVIAWALSLFISDVPPESIKWFRTPMPKRMKLFFVASVSVGSTIIHWGLAKMRNENGIEIDPDLDLGIGKMRVFEQTLPDDFIAGRLLMPKNAKVSMEGACEENFWPMYYVANSYVTNMLLAIDMGRSLGLKD